MNKTAKTVLKMLDSAIAQPRKQPEPQPDPGPRPSPSWRMVQSLLKYAKLPTDATVKEMDKLGLLFRAELAAMKNHSHDDGRREWKKLRADALAPGKPGAVEVPSFEDIKRRNTEFRRVCRHRASVVSRKGCLIAADILEQAKKQLPDFIDQLMAKETDIFREATGTGIQSPKSPLKTLCDDMPQFIDQHIARLQDSTPRLIDPSTILK